MKLNERLLREVFNDPVLQAARARRGCPSPELLAVAVGDSGDAAGRESLADHLVSCPDCAADYRLAVSVEGWAEEASRAVGRAPSALAPAAGAIPSRRPFGFPVSLLAAAAVLVLVAGLILTLSRRRPQGDLAERGPAAETLTTLPPDHAVLREAPERLGWPAVPDAASYRAALYDSESSLLWKSDSAPEAGVAIPPEVRAKLRPGGVYLWRYFARVGVDERASPVLEFSVLPAK